MGQPSRASAASVGEALQYAILERAASQELPVELSLALHNLVCRVNTHFVAYPSDILKVSAGTRGVSVRMSGLRYMVALSIAIRGTFTLSRDFMTFGDTLEWPPPPHSA